MNSFEMSLAGLLLIWLVTALALKQTSTRRLTNLILLGAALAGTVWFLWSEPTRWQMYPVFIGFMLMFLVIRFSMRKAVKGLLGALAVLMGAAAVALSLLLPMKELLEPTGSYHVGVKTFHLVDEERSERFAEKDGSPREIMVDIWYPAEASRAGTIAYPGTFSKTLANMSKLPHQLFVYLGDKDTQTQRESPVSNAEEAYPLLLFSHGDIATRHQNLSLMQELASRGYIVVGMDHTYNAGYTEFPNGRSVYSAISLDMDIGNAAFYNKLIQTRVGDLSFVIDEIEKLNEADPLLSGKIDLQKIGALGHSLGGSTVSQALVTDERIAAALVMDGRIYADVATMDVQKPIMHMMGEFTRNYEGNIASVEKSYDDPEVIAAMLDHMEQSSRSFDIAFEHQTKDAYQVLMKGFNHYDFTDAPLALPIMGGETNIYDALHAVNQVSTAFFDTYLKGQDVLQLKELMTGSPIVEFSSK